MPEQTLEDAVKALNDAQAFIKERGATMVSREEFDRMAADLGSKLQAAQRPAIFPSGTHRSVASGPYAGMSMLDLSIAKALRQAAQEGRGQARLSLSPDGMGMTAHRAHNAIPAHVGAEWQVLKRAMDSTTAGAGDENVDTKESASAWKDVHLNTVVGSFLPRIAMPTNPFEIPLELGDATFYKGNENVVVTDADLAAVKGTLGAGGVKAVTAWSYELDEDSIIAMMPHVRETFVRNVAQTIDELLLSADSTAANGINSDGSTLAASSRWLYGGGDGLIHLPIVDNTGQASNHNAAISAAMFETILSKMQKYALNPAGGNNQSSSDVVFISDLRTWLQGLGLAEVITVDKLGPAATIRTGQLGSMYGIPWLVSAQMLAADTDGKVTAAGNGTDTGRVLGVNRRGWFHGFRREIMVETEKDIEKSQIKMVVSFRMALAARGTRSSAKHTAMAYNITGI